jgi:hypothetical protein
MRKVAMQALVILGLAMLLQAIAGQARLPETNTILEVTDTIHGMSAVRFLYVELRSDGQAKWEKIADGGKVERHAPVLSPDDLASLVKGLNSLDTTRLYPKLGPYNAYTDTSAELIIEALISGTKRQFILWNPWPCGLPSCSMGNKKPMPSEVRALFCEISGLRATLANEPLPPMCVVSGLPKSKKPRK